MATASGNDVQAGGSGEGRSEDQQKEEKESSLVAEIMQWQAKTALMKRRKRLLLEELYFAALECEEEPRKRKKGDLFSGPDCLFKDVNKASSGSVNIEKNKTVA